MPTNSFENQLSAEIGQGLYYRVFAASSGPIVDDTLLYRISAAYKKSEGRITNATMGRKVDDYDAVSLRGRRVWYASDALPFDLRGSSEDLDGRSEARCVGTEWVKTCSSRWSPYS